jgi:hypothetical protein
MNITEFFPFSKRGIDSHVDHTYLGEKSGELHILRFQLVHNLYVALSFPDSPEASSGLEPNTVQGHFLSLVCDLPQYQYDLGDKVRPSLSISSLLLHFVLRKFPPCV